MKEYNLTPQERRTYCVCSVLQAVFRGYGIDLSQDEIAGNLNPSDKGFFVDDTRMKDFLRSKGFDFEYYWHNRTPFGETDTLLEDMTHDEGFIGINSHVYLIRSFNYPVLNIIDPDGNKSLEKNLSEVLSEMQSSGGFFGIIRKLDE